MSVETPLAPFNANDPHATFVSSSCFDLLLIEIVPMIYRTMDRSSPSLERSRGPADDDERKDAAIKRLEAIGYRVGQGLTERHAEALDAPTYSLP